MSISTIEIQPTLAERISIDEESLTIDFVDRRSISVPLEWYPRLWHGTPQERNYWRLIGQGEGIHWPELDEDISVENVWAGQPSGESQRSLKRWLEARNKVQHCHHQVFSLPLTTPSWLRRMRAYAQPLRGSGGRNTLDI
jgi:hypothetical protein